MLYNTAHINTPHNIDKRYVVSNNAFCYFFAVSAVLLSTFRR